MKRLTSLLLLLGLAICLSVAAEANLELKDICAGKYSARRIYGINPLNDGEQYSQLSPDNKHKDKYIEGYNLVPARVSSVMTTLCILSPQEPNHWNERNQNEQRGSQ